MDVRTHSGPMAEDPARFLKSPRPGRSVWPWQRCPVFALRAVRLGQDEGCWFCRYANFHLREPNALDVGVCAWPEVQSD